MDTALKQAIGELLLNAVPTIVLFLSLYFAYRKLVHEPLTMVLAERHSKTAGAVAKAQADIAEAEARTADYEQKLREARGVVFRTMDARRKELLEARSAALAEAKTKAVELVKAAKVTIESETKVAKAGLQAQASTLTEAMIRAILKSVSSPAASAGQQ